MKRLLFLINTLDGGGAEKVLVDTVNALPKDRYDVTLMTVKDEGIFRSRLDKNVKYKSIVRSGNYIFKRVFADIISYVIPAKITHRLFMGNKYDYEIAFLEGVPTKLISASSNKASKKYAWVHIDLYNTDGPSRSFNNDDRKQADCYRRLDKIICVSESTKEAFIKRFGDFGNIEVKYNIIDDEAIIKQADESVEKNDIIRVVSVGRLSEQKGYDRLLRITKRLRDEKIDFELIIVGEGSERRRLEKYIIENELNVTLTGFSDNPYKYMMGADLLVFPSRYEGMSTVATEAVILGKPIVATECSGMREILGDSEYGIITDNNENALYNGVKRMLTDEQIRTYYSDRARERSKKLTKAARLEELLELF